MVGCELLQKGAAVFSLLVDRHFYFLYCLYLLSPGKMQELVCFQTLVGCSTHQ